MDILDKLRSPVKHPQELDYWRQEAIAEIERLRAKIEELELDRVLGNPPDFSRVA